MKISEMGAKVARGVNWEEMLDGLKIIIFAIKKNVWIKAKWFSWNEVDENALLSTQSFAKSLIIPLRKNRHKKDCCNLCFETFLKSFRILKTISKHNEHCIYNKKSSSFLTLTKFLMLSKYCRSVSYWKVLFVLEALTDVWKSDELPTKHLSWQRSELSIFFLWQFLWLDSHAPDFGRNHLVIH